MRISFTSTPVPSPSWLTRLGATGFTVFLVKGLCWLLAPVLFALMRP